MMSRMILNLHQTADEGLYSTISFSPSFDILTSVEHSNDDTEEYRNPWVASKWDANGL
ncbi:hypothetical protein VKT23_011096 [Stygiomarasmius scandens]|uniref:Uncharacterized protein n=1 Tax=Marasmiellus scandens TaxID=2682957 RepID=A0ABR1JEJ9_9AGAR